MTTNGKGWGCSQPCPSSMLCVRLLTPALERNASAYIIRQVAPSQVFFNSSCSCSVILHRHSFLWFFTDILFFDTSLISIHGVWSCSNFQSHDSSQGLFVSKDESGMKTKLREQLQIYSYQFKGAGTVFTKDQMALTGKVGGMKDDLAICLQLALYHTQLQSMRAGTNCWRKVPDRQPYWFRYPITHRPKTRYRTTVQKHDTEQQSKNTIQNNRSARSIDLNGLHEGSSISVRTF